MQAFRDLRVVEIAGSVAGAYAGKLFSDFGATVLKVEPPSGDPARAMGERWNGMGTLFAYLNTGKRSLVLETETDAGRSRLAGLLAQPQHGPLDQRIGPFDLPQHPGRGHRGQFSGRRRIH